MKANELRLHNYVLEDGQVVLLSTNYDLFKCLVNVDRGIGFEPIPLTEEWLLKLGFEKIPKKQYMTLFFSESDLSKADNLRQRIDFWFGDIDFQAAELCFYGVCFKRVKMQYVHQLQNLCFALTGQELTILS